MRNFKIFLVLLLGLIAFFGFISSCNKDESKNTEFDNHIIDKIKKLGLRTDMIKDLGDFYLVEGCYHFDKHETDTRQWNSNNLVSNSNISSVSIFIDGSIPTTGVDNWRPAINNAVAAFNGIPNCLVNLTVVLSAPADITIQADGGNLDNLTIADALLPSNNNVGNTIRINLDFDNNLTIGELQMRYNMVHEIGHAIGFRHSNWMDLNDNPAPGFNLVFGSPAADPISVFNGGTANFNWTGFSAWDLFSIQMLHSQRTTVGAGTVAEGADIASGLINNNAIPDLLFMANDAPSGPNEFRYRIGFDIDNFGTPVSFSNQINVSGLGNVAEGAGATLGDVNGNGIIDLILMANDAPSGPNQLRYKVLFDLNPTTGNFTSQSGIFNITGVGNVAEGASATLVNIDNNPSLDLVLMAYDAPSGQNQFRYKIGFNLSTTGAAATWSANVNVAGVSNVAQGAGIAFTNLDANPRPEIILMAEDSPSGQNQYRYIVGFNVSTAGIATAFSAPFLIPGTTNESNGAGITIRNIDNNGAPEFIFMSYDNPSGANEFRYRIGYNVNATGAVAGFH